MNKLPPSKVIPLLMVSVIASVLSGGGSIQNSASKEQTAFTDKFDLEKCAFTTTGRNDFFLLEPGYQTILAGVEGEDAVQLTITVLPETEKIGAWETRVVEERETENGQLIEVSRNYFALCTQTNSVFYFGEAVDIYENGKVVSHSGAWRADSAQAQAGLMMPGLVLLGARYYQEIAPGVALDRAEIVSLTESLATPAGRFNNCLKTEETTLLEPKAKECKIYAPGVGLIKDGDLLLTHYGFLEK